MDLNETGCFAGWDKEFQVNWMLTQTGQMPTKLGDTAGELMLAGFLMSAD